MYVYTKCNVICLTNDKSPEISNDVRKDMCIRNRVSNILENDLRMLCDMRQTALIMFYQNLLLVTINNDKWMPNDTSNVMCLPSDKNFNMSNGVRSSMCIPNGMSNTQVYFSSQQYKLEVLSSSLWVEQHSTTPRNLQSVNNIFQLVFAVLQLCSSKNNIFISLQLPISYLEYLFYSWYVLKTSLQNEFCASKFLPSLTQFQRIHL